MMADLKVISGDAEKTSDNLNKGDAAAVQPGGINKILYAKPPSPEFKKRVHSMESHGDNKIDVHNVTEQPETGDNIRHVEGCEAVENNTDTKDINDNVDKKHQKDSDTHNREPAPHTHHKIRLHRVAGETELNILPENSPSTTTGKFDCVGRSYSGNSSGVDEMQYLESSSEEYLHGSDESPILSVQTPMSELRKDDLSGLTRTLQLMDDCSQGCLVLDGSDSADGVDLNSPPSSNEQLNECDECAVVGLGLIKRESRNSPKQTTHVDKSANKHKTSKSKSINPHCEDANDKRKTGIDGDHVVKSSSKSKRPTAARAQRTNHAMRNTNVNAGTDDCESKTPVKELNKSDKGDSKEENAIQEGDGDNTNDDVTNENDKTWPSCTTLSMKHSQQQQNDHQNDDEVTKDKTWPGLSRKQSHPQHLRHHHRHHSKQHKHRPREVNSCKIFSRPDKKAGMVHPICSLPNNIAPASASVGNSTGEDAGMQAGEKKRNTHHPDKAGHHQRRISGIPKQLKSRAHIQDGKLFITIIGPSELLPQEASVKEGETKHPIDIQVTIVKDDRPKMLPLPPLVEQTRYYSPPERNVISLRAAEPAFNTSLTDGGPLGKVTRRDKSLVITSRMQPQNSYIHMRPQASSLLLPRRRVRRRESVVDMSVHHKHSKRAVRLQNY